jgi:hypothetical protein
VSHGFLNRFLAIAYGSRFRNQRVWLLRLSLIHPKVSKVMAEM